MKPASYWKIGAFVVAGAALALVAVVYLSSGTLGRSTIDYEVYFDESVQGLEVGALVRFRGITLGQVKRIRVAPDLRHIEVTCALRTGELRTQGLELKRDGRSYLALPRSLRAQLAVIGLTGQEIVSLDYVDPNTHPVAQLPFKTPERTIPAAPSLFATIANSVEAASDQLPGLVGSARELVEEGLRLLGPLQGEDVAQEVRATLKQASDTLASIQRITRGLSAERTPENLGRAAASLDSVLSSVRALLEGMGGERGLLGGTRRAADAVVGTTQATNPLGRELAETLRNAQGALEAVRRLVDTIDREPDILIKGRARSHP